MDAIISSVAVWYQVGSRGVSPLHKSIRVGVRGGPGVINKKEAFDMIKVAIATAPVFQSYDLQKEVSLTCDASCHGLGAECLPGGKPVVYA